MSLFSPINVRKSAAIALNLAGKHRSEKQQRLRSTNCSLPVIYEPTAALIKDNGKVLVVQSHRLHYGATLWNHRSLKQPSKLFAFIKHHSDKKNKPKGFPSGWE